MERTVRLTERPTAERRETVESLLRDIREETRNLTAQLDRTGFLVITAVAAADRLEAQRAVAGALDDVASAQRRSHQLLAATAWYAVHRAGMSYNEVARLLGVSRPVVTRLAGEYVRSQFDTIADRYGPASQDEQTGMNSTYPINGQEAI